MARAQLFLSHIGPEADLAQVLKRRLEHDFHPALDIFVSSDGESIEPGRSWLQVIKTALENARLLVVLCSSESIARPWVNFEAGAGWVRGIPVIPLCHSGLTPIQLPFQLQSLQTLQATNVKNLQSLYETIARALDLPTPSVDLDGLAAEMRDAEALYLAAREARNRIESPQILCAATDQYAQPELGFHMDVDILEKCFPGRVRVERQLNSALLRRLLTDKTQHYDIVHLVQAVDPTNGDLLFHPIDFQSYKPTVSRPDKMTAAAFAKFIEDAGAKLVVLNTCQALFLAARVAEVANMVATHVDISGDAAARWATCFYELLTDGYSVYEAFERTCVNVDDVPMALIRHKDFSVAPGVRGEDSVPRMRDTVSETADQTEAR